MGRTSHIAQPCKAARDVGAASQPLPYAVQRLMLWDVYCDVAVNVCECAGCGGQWHYGGIGEWESVRKVGSRTEGQPGTRTQHIRRATHTAAQ